MYGFQDFLVIEAPQRHLRMLCKHFAHKLEVHADPDHTHARIHFEDGTCTLAVEAGGLRLQGQASGVAQAEALKEVIRVHLQRFIGREAPPLTWYGASVVDDAAG